MSHRNPAISNWDDESPEAKAGWFQSLPLSERMDMLCFFTDLILDSNPRIVDSKDAQPLAKPSPSVFTLSPKS